MQHPSIPPCEPLALNHRVSLHTLASVTPPCTLTALYPSRPLKKPNSALSSFPEMAAEHSRVKGTPSAWEGWGTRSHPWGVCSPASSHLCPSSWAGGCSEHSGEDAASTLGRTQCVHWEDTVCTLGGRSVHWEDAVCALGGCSVRTGRMQCALGGCSVRTGRMQYVQREDAMCAVGGCSMSTGRMQSAH